MSRPSSSVVLDPESMYVPVQSATPQFTSNGGQYSPGSGQYSPGSGQYSPGTGQYSPGTGQYSPGQYKNKSQYIPVTSSQYSTPTSQYIPVPCTVKSSPVCQADVSHEIIRPTPRRPTDKLPSTRLGSLSPTRANTAAYVVSVPTSGHNTTHIQAVPGYPPYSSAYPNNSHPPGLTPVGAPLTIPIAGRKSNSPPSRSTSRGQFVSPSTPVSRDQFVSPSTPVSRDQFVSSNTPVSRDQFVSPSGTPVQSGPQCRGTPVSDGVARLGSASPAKPEHNNQPDVCKTTTHGMSGFDNTPVSRNSSASERLGSPFWCGVSSRDPLSRQYEYPERDVPATTTTVDIRGHLVTAVALPESNSAHVTNVVIDRSPTNSYNPTHGLNVNTYESSEFGNKREAFDIERSVPGAADNEDDDSCGERHPAVRQGRSSLIKYKANHKSKPKRKFVNHVNHGSRDNLKRHEHVKHGVDSERDRVPVRSRQQIRQGYSKMYSGVLPEELTKSLENANRLLEVKAAIEQLSIGKNNASTRSSTSTYSSLSEGESEPVSHSTGGRDRKKRNSSQETLNTTVTSADEFVWIDSHNRLVEVQQLPWNNEDFFKVLQNGSVRESASKISMEVIPRLSYYMQRVLVRIAREAQRLSRKVGLCTKHEVMSALRIVLSPSLASSSLKACLRSGAMYSISSDQTRQSKSSRAGLFLDIGKVHQWMCIVKIGKFIQEYAAVYMTAGLENILEEVITHCLTSSSEVTASILEQCISGNPELWGIFQPYAHLSSCRTSKGSLSVPKCINLAPSDTVRLTSTIKNIEKSMTQILLTTCVGSVQELDALISTATQFYQKYYQPMAASGGAGKQTPSWNKDSLHILYHFMRCSQLENQGCEMNPPIQELVYERPYMVLPPLVEWLRVTIVFCESRFSVTVDKDDVFQAARILLPGADFPPRGQAFNDQYTAAPNTGTDELEYVNSMKKNAAFQMLLSGRKDLIPHALQMLPATKVNTPNQQGLTPLMVACLREDVAVVRLLLETGASIDFANSGPDRCQEQANPEQKHWTALTYATMTGNSDVVRLLLEKGANVEGGVDVEDDVITETPLQLAAAQGRVDIVDLLLSFGASPFLSTLKVDTMSFGSDAQKGSYCALSTGASHGQRKVLHKLVTHPTTLTSQNSGKEVLSLFEILAEGVSNGDPGKDERQRSEAKKPNKGNLYSRFTKAHVRKLQEAMYHSTENGNIEITLDLRNFGVPWTLHSWIRTLFTAQQNGLGSILDELLQDFSKDWPDDSSSYFTDECLPILFSIFRTNKLEGTMLLLADVFSACYGKEPITEIILPKTPEEVKAPRIDPKFVNNPELSDIQFRVEGRLFYAHKLVLITSSFKFRSMLNSKFCEGSPPILQINDIRYEIFEMVMQYLYKGSSEDLVVEASDILELMAAANFFQLDGLLHFCEVRCANLIDLDTIVSYYIHAKVYSAEQLLAYCEGFLLQNMVALLTYDDSVKRLIFGKKLQNHDVLTGLLKTLQNRIRKKGNVTKLKKISL